MITTGKNIHSRMRGNINLNTAPDGTNLETGAVVREWIRSVFVGEFHRDQKLRIVWITIVNVANLREVELVPLVRTIGLDSISLVEVINSIAERISGAF